MFRLKIAKPDIKCPKCKVNLSKLKTERCPICHNRMRALLRNSGIPHQCILPFSALQETPHNKELLHDMHKTLDTPALLSKNSIFIHGRTGSGKTLHACVFGTHLIRRHFIDTAFIQVSEHLNALKRLFASQRNQGDIPELEDNSLATSQHLLSLKKKRALIMDDINRKYTEFELETIYNIIDYRYRNKLFTIFTAQDKHLAMLPEQTSTRIAHMCQPYYLGNTNMRNHFSE